MLLPSLLHKFEGLVLCHSGIGGYALQFLVGPVESPNYKLEHKNGYSLNVNLTSSM